MELFGFEIQILKDLLTVLAIGIGGVWAIFKFIIFRQFSAQLETDLLLRYIGESEGNHVVEVTAALTNKGAVRIWIRNFFFSILTLNESEELKLGDTRVNKQLEFNRFAKRRLLPPKWNAAYVDPKITQNFSHVTIIPDDAKFLLIKAKFDSLLFFRTWTFQKTFNFETIKKS
ncbi:MAG: hypothetical protein RIM99_14480 [Cyclobacteriaceae bacterium]